MGDGFQQKIVKRFALFGGPSLEAGSTPQIA
jgi:hypothetical protein